MNDLVTLHDPFTRPASFLLVETVTLVLAALTFVHARRHRQLLTWVTIVVYGVAMEIISYHFAHNFDHGQFTVMFYRHQLPLYITAVYPVLLYTGIATARRLGLTPAREAMAAGLLIVALDVPYDLIGPHLGWWRWLDGDPNTAVRWAGVPVTSFFWHVSFGGILAFLTRRPRHLGWAPLCALGTIVLGTLAFLPFHGAVALGLDDGVFVAGALIAAGAAVLAGRPRWPGERALATLWAGWYGCLFACILLLR